MALSTDQERIILKIDNKLDLLLKNMKYEDYLEFIKSDDYLSTYDDVLGYYEIQYLPEIFLKGLTVDFLNKVLDRVDKKIKELKIEEQ